MVGYSSEEGKKLAIRRTTGLMEQSSWLHCIWLFVDLTICMFLWNNDSYIYINIYIQGDNSLLTKNRKSINICANCLLSKTFNQILKFQASEERGEAIICQFKGYSAPPPYKYYWEGEACALCSYVYGIEYGWLRFWRRKEVNYKEPGPQVFWNRVVDYIVWCWL